MTSIIRILVLSCLSTGVSVQAAPSTITIDISSSLKWSRPYVEMKKIEPQINSTVITSRENYATVLAYNPETKKVTVNERFNSNRTAWHHEELVQYTLDNLAITEGCNGTFCIDDSVYVTHGFGKTYLGAVKGFFPGGKIAVHPQFFEKLVVYNQEDVHPAFGCNARFCENDLVYTKNGNTGSVAGFHTDGRIFVTSGTRLYPQLNVYKSKELSVTRLSQ